MKNVWDSYGLNRWEYGLGAGIGVEIWKIQVIGRYNWNFGSLSDLKSEGNVAEALANAGGKGKFGGFSITAAVLF